MTIITVADPELQIRGGGGGGGHTDPEIREVGAVSKKIFRASIWSKNKRKPEPPWPLPWIRH